MAKKKAKRAAAKRAPKTTPKKAPKKRQSSKKKATKRKPAKRRSKKKATKKAAKKKGARPAKSKSPAKSQAEAYDKIKEAAALASRGRSATGRDIGKIPEVVDAKRRKRGVASLQAFCEEYAPEAFHMGWSDDHLLAISKLEQSAREGGLFALAMPRGSGKTTLSVFAAIWSLLCGHRRFVALICVSQSRAEELLESIKTELECNERLLEDFPEVCYPIVRLDRIYNRCKGQTCGGEPTRMTFTKSQLVLPAIKGSAAAAATIRVAGITGGFRGMQHTRPDGQRVRPDLCLIDDPQDDQSAASVAECAKNERIIAGAILGLAGPGKTIAGVMPCTVIRRGDLASRFLDPEIHPEWRGQTTAMLKSFPTDEKRWDEYAELRREGLRSGDGGKAATAYYKRRRKAMDKGAVASWAERFRPGELSAIQHAMNLKLDDEAAFWAEYQNQPLDDDRKPEGLLTADEIARRLNGLKRGTVMLDASRLVAFADVQDKCFYWMVCAFSDNFTGQVVDYGTWPDQQLRYFTLRQAKRTLARKFPGQGFDGKIYSGLEAMTDWLLSEREFVREDGAVMTIDLLAYDANWGKSTMIVKRFCRQSRHRAKLKPSHGAGYGASRQPINSTARKAGERRGDHWREPPLKRGDPVRHILWDTNYFKSFAHARLATAVGDRGSLTLFGDSPAPHRMPADHFVSEQPETVTNESTGRTVDEWNLKPNCDNHFLDTLVGCVVLGSYMGCDLLPGATVGTRPLARRKLSELRKAKKR